MLFMKIFDAVLLVYGGYTIYCGVQMKKTGKPSSWLVGAEENNGKLDQKAFVSHMFRPTLLLGMICMLYGAVSAVNDFVQNLGYGTKIVMLVFLLFVLWYCWKLHKVKEEFSK